jgi:hypothetical protein
MESTKQPGTPPAEVDPRYPNTPIGIVRSRDAFLRDLPTLLANPKYDRWSVAYCGDERIAISESLTAVQRECCKRGLANTEYFIGCVFPHSMEEEEEIDFGLAEFEIDEEPSSDETKPIS